MRAVRAAPWLLAALVLTGCPAPRSVDRIVLVTLDTTRADHLGCYGYEGASTPFLDRLAAEATLFEQALSPVPVTLPAHASIFTGLYPAQHGVRYNGTFRLDARHRTLAEILKDAGFSTFAVPSSFAVARRFGLAQGFDEYLDLFASPEQETSLDAERKAEDVAARTREWLARDRGGRAFAWLHFYDPHWRYAPPFPFSTRFRERPYDGEIAYVDQELGKVLDTLRADPRAWQRTLLIVVGDHGEGLYDHGEAAHGVLAYQSTLRVPLLIKPPGRRGAARISAAVSLVDLLPTVLDYAGIPGAAGSPGISLRPALEGEAVPPRALYFEALAGALNYGWSRLEGILRGNFKLIDGVDPELYDLLADPAETHSLLPGEGTRAAELRQELDETLASFEAQSGEVGSGPELDAETLERLASLGYVGVRGSDGGREGPDPKRLIFLDREILEAQSHISKQEWQDAIELSEYVLKHDPLNRIALTFAARGSLESGQAEQALRWAETLAHRHPRYEFGHDLLGRSLRALGRGTDVVQAYRVGSELNPASSLLYFRLMLAYLEIGQERTACSGAEQGKVRWPSLPDYDLLIARCQTRRGDLQAAVSSLRSARETGLDPAPFVTNEADLAPLRDYPPYRALLAEPLPRKED